MKPTMKKPADILTRMLARRLIPAQEVLPLVSVVTPTWNRRSFLPYLLYMFQYQDYPAHRRELVILDDSEQSNADLVDQLKKYAPHAESIRYYHQTGRMTLGQKRNRLNQLAGGEYIICMDDDDYYPPDKISYTIAMMQRHKALFAGCDQIPIWYSHINRIFLSHAFGPHHALNGTFACHRNFLNKHRYDDKATLSEEDHFLHNFTSPVLQLDPYRSILCISHHDNTFDKSFVMGSCEPDTRQLEQIVSDAHLRKFYQRLYQAPVNSKINWDFFAHILVLAHSGDDQTQAQFVRSLLEQGVNSRQLTVITPPPGQPPAWGHLQAAEQAQRAGWHNYLLLDDRTCFVRQEKTVRNLNQLLAACQALAWDVLLLGGELEQGHPLQALPCAIKATRINAPIAYAVNQASYRDFIAMLQPALSAQSEDGENLPWHGLCASGRWFALYPGYIWRDTDDQGQPLAHRFFRKLHTTNGAHHAGDPQ